MVLQSHAPALVESPPQIAERNSRSINFLSASRTYAMYSRGKRVVDHQGDGAALGLERYGRAGRRVLLTVAAGD
ncbi:MAG: hypothetical protein WKF30_11755 [Pyrinomonadaceae bacterium]